MKELILNQGINLNVIWNETGFLFCLIVFTVWVMFTLWATKNWKESIMKECNEELETLRAKAFALNVSNKLYEEQVDELKSKIKIRKRDAKGRFIND